ncbi:putative quinol monooxygenase [Jiulongibacter sp. NS-SX5]|uniref:putative quinol monooxygenase n=1 Tax=Jiulongibacter sp. NS-SX5 TaxID=3463854 RepID=UPI00405992D0
MSKYFLHGSLNAKEGKGEELAGILLEASALVSKAKGCQLYLISISPEEPDTVWVTEVWDSEEDHKASLKNEEVRSLISKAMPILGGQPQQGQTLVNLGGHGV